MRISPARIAAFDALIRIFRDAAFSSIVLPSAEAELTELDRGLCHELVLGVLRTRLSLDAAIDRFANGKKLDLEVRTAAQLGLYQLTSLQKIPRYSAVSESVSLVQRAKKTSAKGFVNALLRRGASLFETLEHTDPLDQLSVETSHPRWLLARWVDQFGIDATRRLADANNQKPKAAFRMTRLAVMDGFQPPAGWESSKYAKGGYVTERMTNDLRELADSGHIYFQDEGSQLVGSLALPAAGSRFLDVAAAPGSKTTLIAAAARDAHLVAGDLRQSRVRILRSNCEAQGVRNVDVVRYDAADALPFADGSFDTVLVDAPCSGTGTIRNNPEIRYFLQQSDMGEFRDKQLAILRNASKLVGRDGTLVYSTCSLEHDENEDVISAFLTESDKFLVEKPAVADELLTDAGFVRTSPAEHEMDGFFAAVLRRRGDG